jgi:hypothetical protein
MSAKDTRRDNSTAPGQGMWSAPAERSDDGALARRRTAKEPPGATAAKSKAAWRFASRRTPKYKPRRFCGARLCEPQHGGRLVRPEPSQFVLPARRLRLADPRSDLVAAERHRDTKLF